MHEQDQPPPTAAAEKARTPGGHVTAPAAPAAGRNARLSASDGRQAAVIFSVAVLLHTYRLQCSPRVVFDETHVGGYVRQYFQGRFFVDVHPPLGKLVFYWLALLGGWDGQFGFGGVGDVYDTNVPFVAMRLFLAACAAAAAVLVFLALRFSGCRLRIACLGALAVVFENSLATQARVVMLDSALVAFTAAAVAAFQRFQAAEPFSRPWLKAMLLTGVAEGLAAATKLPGLFTAAWVGAWSLVHMWRLAGDVRVPGRQLALHAASRAVAFAGVPAAIYCGLFAVHFRMLPLGAGAGDAGLMAPAFKAALADAHGLRNTAVDVLYGSTVSVRHHRMDAYLHLHEYTYVGGSGQQQVTMYGYDPDTNNEWVLEPHGTYVDGALDAQFRPVKDGDSVRVFHKASRKYLRANDVRPPRSEHDYLNEVACHGGHDAPADIDLEWTVRIVGKKPHAQSDLALRKLRATESVFQLVHRGTHCVLMGHDTRLPAWAFGQLQVLCVNGPTLANTLWYIEANRHPAIDADALRYPRVHLPGLLLWAKMAHYHRSMWRVNKGLAAPHAYASLPLAWPLAARGINYFSNGHGLARLAGELGSHVYLVGNVAVYWGGLAVVVLVAVRLVLVGLRRLNPFVRPAPVPAAAAACREAQWQYASGWALHYVPYMFMERQLYAHHYLPCVLFLVLGTAQYVEAQAGARSRLAAAAWVRGYDAYLCAVVYVFVRLRPLVHGSAWTVAQCQAAKWLPGWDFDCMAYSH
ncbi:PMT-domain-containing protein [Metschnikowia bicuspidata var. bicuspidata NRRL YB-4993]|uniref:Dolichyl-phosphate-mannose--protein mannosyltransferase n=1 Tax=Metschnikowia bicuspidata var. bicuspidata NRRL YB-4993 TaxID=869754 RepID=A0A1A0HJI3_9ASCO|nr:PMT-domain-containing protein [Metschnikowia bicuspidata var. bicuspidata NRRL YB-4993]OBA24047.1 PMT-domain-containing protein [Metschnikowia bicuspidata var. bicuspidata NRRL YB-4993]